MVMLTVVMKERTLSHTCPRLYEPSSLFITESWCNLMAILSLICLHCRLSSLSTINMSSQSMMWLCWWNLIVNGVNITILPVLPQSSRWQYSSEEDGHRMSSKLSTVSEYLTVLQEILQVRWHFKSEEDVCVYSLKLFWRSDWLLFNQLLLFRIKAVIQLV